MSVVSHELESIITSTVLRTDVGHYEKLASLLDSCGYCSNGTSIQGSELGGLLLDFSFHSPLSLSSFFFDLAYC